LTGRIDADAMGSDEVSKPSPQASAERARKQMFRTSQKGRQQAS
jgi:hypothetical protein